MEGALSDHRTSFPSAWTGSLFSAPGSGLGAGDAREPNHGCHPGGGLLGPPTKGGALVGSYTGTTRTSSGRQGRWQGSHPEAGSQE